MNYTYPKGVLAEQRKSIVNVSDNEILTFVEVDQNDSIDVHFKFGRQFKQHLKSTLKSANKSTSITALEEQTYQSDVKTFKNFFDSKLVHHNMMRFILNTLGIEEEATQIANYNRLYSQKVLSFIENFSILGKYKPVVFIEKSQLDVYHKTEEPTEGNQKVFPKPNEIYIWLVSKDYINYDTSFIKVQFGTNVAKDLKQREVTKEFVEQLVLKQIKDELQLNIFSKETVDKGVIRGLADAMIRLWIIEKLEESNLNKEVFETNPALFLSLQAASFAVEKLESKKFKEHNWNPKLPNYSPLVQGDTLYNALICGLINGVIDEIKAIPEMVEFFSKIFGSEKEYEEFVNGIKKLLDEGIIKTIIEGATKEYREALKEGNVEKLYYNFAHDIIQIVSLLVGIFQLAKGVSSFVNLSRKALTYIKRFGRKSIDDLKLFNKKEIRKIFDDLEIDSKVRAKKTAQFKQFVKKWKGKSIAKLTPKEISENLKGFTQQANRVAKLIDDGDMIIKILDDVEFEKLLMKYGDTLEEAKATAAFNIKEKNYFRASKPVDEFMSEIVHEGTHTLDDLNGFVGDVYQIEKRAFFHERAFQKAVEIGVDFEKIEDLLDFIYINY